MEEKREILETVETENIIMDVVDEVEAKNYNSLKAVVGIGLAGVAGALTYKYIVNPLINKAKARKLEKQQSENINEYDVNEDCYEEE